MVENPGHKHVTSLSSAFVIDSNIVVCSYNRFVHASGYSDIYYLCANADAIKVEYIDSIPEFDMAVFRCKFVITKTPVIFGQHEKLHNNDGFTYNGFHKHTNESILGGGIVNNVDTSRKAKGYIGILKFSGEIDGTPGAPIFTVKGKVVGVVTKWPEKKVNDQYVGMYGNLYDLPLLAKKIKSLRQRISRNSNYKL